MDPAATIMPHADRFAPMRRERGQQLFDKGAVAIVHHDDEEIEGRVTDFARGRQVEHEVFLLFLDAQELDVSCGCRGPEFCEHGYALLLAEQQRRTGNKRAARPAPVAPKAPTPTPPPTPPPTPAAQMPVSSAPDWRKRLQAVAERLDDVPPPSRQQRLLHYLIHLDATRKTGRLHVNAMVQVHGKPTAEGTFALQSIRSSATPQSFPEQDRHLMQLLEATRDDIYLMHGEYAVAGAWMPIVVPLLFATGRVHHIVEGGTGQPLPLDPGEPFAFRTRLERTGESLHVHGVLERNGETVTYTDVNAVVDGGLVLLRTRAIRARFGHATAFARTLLHDGPLTTKAAEQRELLAKVLEMTHGDPDVAPPVPTRTARAPSPVFLVHMAKSTPRHVHCELQFDYGNMRVDLEGPDLLPEPDGDTWLLRDKGAETAATKRLLELAGPEAQPTGVLGCLTVSRKVLSLVLARVVDAGLRVLADGKPLLRYESFKVSVNTNIDWFDVEGVLDFGSSASLPLAKALLAHKRGERFVQLGDGLTGVLPEEWLQRWAAVLELGEANGDGVRLRSSQALLLDALLSAKGPAEITTDKGFRSLKKRLASFSGIAARIEPTGFQGELRTYQRQGLGWLHFLRELRLGGCLADDMGLGKTVQVLALLQEVHAARDLRPSLLVVPRSLLDNWHREAARFTPSLRIAMFVNAGRWERLGPARLAEHDLIITTYGTLRADAARFEQEQITFEYAILDEAQAIENDASVTSKAVRLLRSNHRLALTGTPVQNHLGELWALFEFLSPGLLGRSSVFQSLVGNGKNRDAALDGKLLQKALAPFLLRRTKEQVLPELPQKQEQVLACELDGTQRAAYDALREHYRDALQKGGAQLDNRERFVALEALLRLRQAACHEALIDERLGARSSAKLDALVPMLQEIAASGHKALVFSQFVGFLTIVRARLDALGMVYEYLDGKTRDRQQRVDRFQGDAGCPVFLISLKAGGFGLNLTAADYVFVLDPWWNPAAEAQAIDRAHRLGQQRKVVAYRLVATDTVEEKVLKLQDQKRALVESVLGGDGGSLLAGMTREDLLGLIG